MVIQPVLPVAPPELGDAPSPRVLPFRRDSGFLDMLRRAAGALPGGANPSAQHRVQAGESLWRICEAELTAAGRKPSKTDINAAVKRVAAANRLKDADVLAVGQQLDMSTARTGAALPMGQSQGRAMPGLSALTERPSPLSANPGAPVASAPMAALAGPRNAAKGGAATAPRPIFRRLSNARPALHTYPHETRPVPETVADAPKPVDLTALMQSILEPGAAAPDTATPSAGPWSKLLAGAGRYTSGFGLRSDPFSGKPQFHDGIDIAAAAGTEIYPYMAGTVKSAGWDPGRGNVVVIEHPNGLETVYAHTSEMLVAAGDIVMKDTPIAKVGSTGRSTGPHLHFEVRQDLKAIDPMPFVKAPSLDIAKAS